MTPDPAPYDELLAAYDEALDAGSPLPSAPGGSGELARDLDCLYRLHRWKAGRAPAEAAREVGRFHIRRELGRGGFGVVYLAFDPRLGRDVALKVPRPDVLASDELRERFHREARAAAGLDHPNVVPVYEAGEAGPACYIASAYCPGPTLREWLRGRAEPVPVADAAALVAALADGAGHAHARGIVHRDLKPANILLAEDEGGRMKDETKSGSDSSFILPPSSFRPKITDFGLAKLADPGEASTRSGAVLGTPSYMAPEQAEGRREVGPAADVYALGVILYELLTGRPPFVGETDLDTLRQAGSRDPVPPSRLRVRLPRDLETVCLKCLEKEPHRRYPTAAELAADLRRFLAGEPVTARRIGAVGRAWKLARRRPVVSGLLAAVVALAVGGTAAVTVLWRQAETALASEAVQRGKTEAELAEKLTILARIEWEADRVGQAAAHLRDCPEAHRGREWRYLDRMCRAEVMSFPHPADQSSVVAYSPDGRFVASAIQKELTVWDLTNRARAFGERIVSGPNRSLTFSPDGRELNLLTWLPSLADLAAEAEPTTERRARRVVPLGSDARGIAERGSWRMTAWDARSGRPIRSAEFARPATGAAAACPVGPLYATQDGGRVRIENLATGRVVEFAHGHTALKELGFNAGGRHLLSAGPDEPIKVWDASDGRQLYAVSPPQAWWKYLHPNREPLSLDGRRLAVVRRKTDTSTMLAIWDAELGRELLTLPRGSFNTHGYQFSPDGRYLAVAALENSVRVWDLTTAREMLILRGHTMRVHAIAFSPDGRQLTSVGQDQTVRVWDVSPFDE